MGVQLLVDAWRVADSLRWADPIMQQGGSNAGLLSDTAIGDTPLNHHNAAFWACPLLHVPVKAEDVHGGP